MNGLEQLAYVFAMAYVIGFSTRRMRDLVNRKPPVVDDGHGPHPYDSDSCNENCQPI